VSDLRIGTYGTACLTAKTSARLVDVLDLLERADVSAIPVVDDAGRVLDMYSRADITFLAAATDAESVISNLDLTLAQVLEQRSPETVDVKDRLHTCSVRTTLQSIFELFAEMSFRRVVAVDETDGRCLGVITARDLIAYFCR
jgi:CBS domain-containing protein